MIVLHSIWSDKKLHVWGENSTRLRAVPKRRGRRPKKPRPHPSAAEVDSLAEAVAALEDSLLPAAARKSNLALRLPSDRIGPLDSPELIRDEAAPPSEKKSLTAWTVPSLELVPADALDLLADLPNDPQPEIAFGASLRYWAEAAKLTLELVVSQQFFPDIDEADETFRAVWRPLWDDDSTTERLQMLADAMPPISRAILRDDESEPGAVELLSSFLTETLDAFIRRGLADASPVFKKKKRKTKKTPLVEQWLAALSSDDSQVVGEEKKLSKFVEDMRSWIWQIHPDITESPFRTCFRLVPPDAPKEDPKRRRRKKKAASDWSVTFHFQARDDKSLLVDAKQVWKTRSRAATLFKRRVENPQEIFLGDLGRASRIFPKLDEALTSPRPEFCELTTDEAYSFLRESAPLLEQSGFGVLVPPWWGKPTARLGAKLRVKPKGQSTSSASGLMGLNSIVDYSWELALGEETISIEEFERLAALKVPLVQVRGRWVELHPDQIEAAIQFFEKERGGEMTLSEAMRLGLSGEDSETGLPVVDLKAEGWIDDIFGDIAAGAKFKTLPTPKTFNGKLRGYQKKGFSWLAFLDSFGLGTCLADDMGLGKTIQLIVLLLHEREGRKKPDPTLLICPMSVVGNWHRELQKFSPSLKVMVHHGSERLSGKAFAREASKHDIVISTYALANRDREHLSAVSWHRVALDEAQNIKNPSAKQTQAIRSFEAAKRVALTGTPVENRLSELWSIMQFLNPGYLSSASNFRLTFATPIEKYHDADRASKLRRLIQPFVLRRLKTDKSIISDLPEKLEMRVFCNLTKEQASLYEAVVKDMMQKVGDSKGIERKGLVLSTLMKLKQVCNHPAQFLKDGSEIHGRSGKLARLVEMLEEALSEGDKALIFTQFAEMGTMLKGHLQKALGREVLFLYGGTSKKARDAMVERFQEEDDGPPVFILSIKAGGTGLNLTAANHVFHFDRWWNPAVENQATDRAFRIGQRKNVQVHKYVCVGTLEERIDQMIEQKKELAESVVGAGENWITELSTDELQELFALSRDAVAEE